MAGYGMDVLNVGSYTTGRYRQATVETLISRLGHINVEENVGYILVCLSILYSLQSRFS
jgi:hypothetical protein